MPAHEGAAGVGEGGAGGGGYDETAGTLRCFLWTKIIVLGGRFPFRAGLTLPHPRFFVISLVVFPGNAESIQCLDTGS